MYVLCLFPLESTCIQKTSKRTFALAEGDRGQQDPLSGYWMSGINKAFLGCQVKSVAM